MNTVIMLLCTCFFAGISFVGFVNPNRVIQMFGATPHADMRNEIRTVYGGMCMAVALVGLAALLQRVPLEIAAALFALILLSNAFGRGVGLLLERSTGLILVFLVVELLLGGAALFVLIGRGSLNF